MSDTRLGPTDTNDESDTPAPMEQVHHQRMGHWTTTSGFFLSLTEHSGIAMVTVSGNKHLSRVCRPEPNKSFFSSTLLIFLSHLFT